MTVELTDEYVTETLESAVADMDLWNLTWYWNDYGDSDGILARLFPELVEEGIENVFEVTYELHRREGWARLEYRGVLIYEAHNERDYG